MKWRNHPNWSKHLKWCNCWCSISDKCYYLPIFRNCYLNHKSGKKDDFTIWWSRHWVTKLERCNYQKPSSRERASQKKVNVLENKVLTLESEHNSLEQYGRRNNIEITGIPDNVPNQILEEKIVNILNKCWCIAKRCWSMSSCRCIKK